MANLATELALACKSWQQAQEVIDDLFSKHLIARAEILPVPKSLEHEVQVIMENFEVDILAIQKEVARLFGHDNFMLQALPR
jgi:hypothetical protein